jgi:hypothetical protein
VQACKQGSPFSSAAPFEAEVGKNKTTPGTDKEDVSSFITLQTIPPGLSAA